MDSQSGPPPLDGFLPEWIHDFYGKLMDWLIYNRPIFGPGLTWQDTANGRLVTLDVATVVAAANQTFALQVYRSTFTGTGTAPDDQALRVKVRRGVIGPEMPSNIDDEFILDDDTSQVVYYEASHDLSGDVVSTMIQVAATLPATPTGSPDHAPTVSYGPLAWVTTAGGTITEIVYDGNSSRDIGILLRKSDCGENTVGYYRGMVLQDFTSAEIQDILNRLAALEDA